MKFVVFLFFAFFFASQVASAQKISVDAARDRAFQFLAKSGKSKAMAVKGLRATDLTSVKCDAQNLYVFNVGGDNGYVIVSGDSRTRSILGYGNGCGINMDEAPANFKAWLKGYDEAIKALDGKDISAQAAAEPSSEPYGAPIQPMLTSQWDQGSPYNDLCPEFEGQQCLTGCPATAMAQVLYYWKAPQHWIHSLPGYQSDIFEGYEFYVPEVPAIKLRWDDMCDTYTKDDNRTEAQKSAVAELMRYCGQACQMFYSPGASGQIGMFVEAALKNHLGFAESTKDIKRNRYTTRDWESMVYDNLSRGIPVPYSGYTNESGHFFVCDGYAGNGMFHINWGWGGMCDNYFLLSLLNPYSTEGAGASSSELGYCLGQEMIINAVPGDRPLGDLPFLEPGLYYGIKQMEQDGSVALQVYNGSLTHGVFEMALATMDAEGNMTPVIKYAGKDGSDAFSLKPDDGCEYHFEWTCDIAAAGLETGIYDLYPVGKCVSVPGDEWHLIYGDQYIRATVDGTSTTAIVMPAVSLTMESVENKGNGHALESQEIVMTLRNNGDVEYNDRILVDVVFDDEDGADTLHCVTGAFIPAGKASEVHFFVTPPGAGTATASVYANQNPNAVVAQFPLSFDEPSQEFVNAITTPEFALSYTYSETEGLVVSFDYTIVNNLGKYVTREVDAIVENKGNKLTHQVGYWKFEPRNTYKLHNDLTFTPDELAEHHFTPDFADGIDFSFVHIVGHETLPLISVHIPFGKTVTQNGEFSGITSPVVDASPAHIYNLQGIQVDDNFKGIVIINGKKVLKK
ncbi:MAG: C10 family peptidase [Muribaculaceae bacterium]|nr:C10 family peptidase [Muribaculaceae bacterium]